MHVLLRDLRLAARQLARVPAFTLACVATLALGVGANTALFSLANAMLLRPRPGVGDAARLVWVTSVDARSQRPGRVSHADYLDYRARRDVFEDVAVMGDVRLAVAVGGRPEQVHGEAVSGNYFALLRTPLALGRAFGPADDAAVAVVGHAFWRTRLGGDSGVVGRTLVVNGRPLTVVGVAPEHFNGAMHDNDRRALWVPTSLLAELFPGAQWRQALTDRSFQPFRAAVGRLRPGVTPARADAAAAAVAAGIAGADPAGHGGRSARTFPAAAGIPPGGERAVVPVTALAAAVTGLVLLVACANVGTLLLSRGVGRRREIAIRMSLGAPRRRLVRQLLAESLLLAAAASAAAWVVADWAVRLVLARALPLPIAVEPDARVLAFSIGIALATTALAGLLPALEATRVDPARAVGDGARGTDARRARLQGSFVVAQVAISALLLVTAGLFLRALDTARRAAVGFDTSPRVLAVTLAPGLLGYTEARTRGLVDALVERAAGLPGVRSASATNAVPMAMWIGGVAVLPRDGRPGAGDTVRVRQTQVRPGFFRTAGIALARGRDFTAADRDGAPGVAIVSESFARRHWPRADALGQRLTMPGPDGASPPLTVVGVAGDAEPAAPGESPPPMVYLPMLQQPPIGGVGLLVRADGDARRLAGALRRELRALDPNLPVERVQTLGDYRDDSLAPQRSGSIVLGILGALALGLAALGVYAVMAFAVEQRTREIGVRVALGGTPAGVVRLLVRHGLRVALTGLAIGLGLALAATRLLASMLLGVTPSDAVTFAAVAALLAGTALLASWIPARRATRVSPTAALRAE